MEKVILDNYRMEFLRPLFDDYGIDYEVIKNPPSIHGLLAPRIDDMFANENIIYGDNPLMRWYTNNVLVRMKADGNRVFEKKEKVRRKTDGFHAFVHALYRADELLEYDVDESLEFLSTFNI